MSRSILLAAFAGAAALAGAALASERDGPRTEAPRADWMPVSEIAAKLEAQGWRVREIDTERGGYEVEVVDASGAKRELWIDPVSGEPVPGRVDD